MKFDINTLQQWEKATDKDFAHLSMQVVLIWAKMLEERTRDAQPDGNGNIALKYNIAEEAERLTSVISREDAAYLFFYGAKAMNSQVSFEEIQEGVMLDGPYRRQIKDEDHEDFGEYTESYPILFVNVVLALQDAYATIKKKPVIPDTS